MIAAGIGEEESEKPLNVTDLGAVRVTPRVFFASEVEVEPLGEVVSVSADELCDICSLGNECGHVSLLLGRLFFLGGLLLFLCCCLQHRLRPPNIVHDGLNRAFNDIEYANGGGQVKDYVSLVNQFREQMQILVDHFQPLTIANALALLHEGKLPANSVCVTFDDGYLNNLEIAAPILSELEIPATVFVATQYPPFEQAEHTDIPSGGGTERPYAPV